MANAKTNLDRIIKLKLSGVKAEAKSLKDAGLIKVAKVGPKNYDDFCKFMANVFSNKKSERKTAIVMAKDGDFVTGTLDPEEFIKTAKAASGLSSTISGMVEEAASGGDEDGEEPKKKRTGKELWQGIADALKDVAEARKGKDVGKTTTTQKGATFARKMFSVEKDRLWNKLEKFLKKNNVKTSAGDLLKMSSLKLMVALKDQGQLNLGKFLDKLIEDYKKAEVIANTKGKEYDAISSGTAFLTEDQINSHLGKFADGLGAFISEKADGTIKYFNKWGIKNNFVTTISKIEGILGKANAEKNTFGVIEKELGFNENQFRDQCSGGTFKTYTISKEKLGEKLYEILRLPEATDDSAFAEEWVAGGLTAGGNPEGVINAISIADGKFAEMVTETTYTVQEDGTWSKS